MRRRWFLLVLITLLASACGWQLRGSFNLPPELTALTVEGHDPYSPLLVQIRDLLNSAGIATPDDAPYQLYIHEEELGKRRFTQNQNVLLDEFMLTHKAKFELKRRDDTLILPQQEALEMTLFQDDQSTAGTKLNEENILRNELAQKLAVTILRKIQAIKPGQWRAAGKPANTGVATDTLPTGASADLPVSANPPATPDATHAPAP